jgi:hypothetical protein
MALAKGDLAKGDLAKGHLQQPSTKAGADANEKDIEMREWGDS